ncbi:hypothetical protein LWC34_23180 [Kibdelosporangium philippinense]|uniref:Uncharacterized protein n=1 Tax=Kibdelosporangium philippinense TaxID=211113 RepID=A0ABS8ZCX8_9PSEU|nr:hypothetical protein [Kibdelosporangium philippinense]MCE7005706.1 hypothetical protein [Kibdelosporangium philippinense]
MADQIAALPDAVLAVLAQVLGVLELTPWHGEPYNLTKPDEPMRQWVFGGSMGEGVIVYLILDDQRRVDVLRVLWFG